MKIGTFFSGIGSPEQALKNLMLDGMEYKNKPLEIDIEFGCEIDKYAKQTYLDNFRPKNFYDDITKLDMEKIPYVDLLIAGFPCQAFSIAGNRLGFEDVRGTLFFDLLRYIKTQQPKYFILENVKGLLSHDKGKTFDIILKCLAKTLNNQISFFKYSDALNYNVHYQVLNTKDYGLPQNRERIFIIGIRDDLKNNFIFPKKIPLKLKLKDILQDNPDSKYYLKDNVVKRLTKYNKRNKEKGNGFQAKFHNIETDNMSCLTASGGGSDDLIKVDEKYYLSDKGIENLKKNQKYNKFNPLDYNSEIAACITARCSKVSNDNNFIEVDEKYYLSERAVKGIENSNYERKKNIIQKNDICATLLSRDYKDPKCIEVKGLGATLQTSENTLYKTNNRIRRLTPLECFRLQGFPDDFKKSVSDTQLYKQAGNTISVPVIESIILNLIQ